MRRLGGLIVVVIAAALGGAGQAAAAPGNDAFANATVVSGATGSTSGVNEGATRESGEPQIAGNAGGKSVWFAWTAPAAGSATIDTVGSSFDTLLGVYTGSSVSSLSLVASNDDIDTNGGNYRSSVTFDAVAGTTYRIVVDGWHSNAGGTTSQGAVQLNWSSSGGSAPPPPPPGGPPNDMFANAQAVSGSSASGSTVDATREAGEPQIAGNAGGQSVWYAWRAPASGPVSIDTLGSSFDTLLGVYTGSTVSSLALVGSNDDIDTNGGTYQSRVQFQAVAGTTYEIAVDGYHSASRGTTASGTVRLNVTVGATGTAGDDFSAALAVSGASGSTTATTVGATKEPGEPAHATDAGGHSIWFRWTAPASGTATFSTAGSSFDTTLAVYTGTAVNALTWVASNDDAAHGTMTSALTFIASAGTSYSVAVDGWGGANGAVRLAWQTGPETPPATGDPVLVAAGDIHANCDGSQAGATAQVVDSSGADAVVVDGDLTDTGSEYQLDNCFGSTWNRFGSRLYPVLGNHEYGRPNASPAFDFFGGRLGSPGQGWYSFDLGTWHVVVLNSNCSQVGGCTASSPQVTWLKQDLAAHRSACTLAFWHHPLFTSVPEPDGNDSSPAGLWQALESGGADVVVNAHSRSYERFAPQTSAGAPSGSGIREFVVGTGGGDLDGTRSSVAANSQAWSGTTFGVLRLTLHASSYDWSFLAAGGGTFADSGSSACH